MEREKIQQMKKIPSKHLLVSRHLEHVLNTSSALQLFVFQDVFKTSWKNVLKTSSKTKRFYVEIVTKMPWKRLEDVLNTCLEDVLNTSWRQTKYLLGISVSSKSTCVSDKFIFHKSISDGTKANPKCIN